DYGDYFRVGERDGTKSLTAPADTGLYEIRYILDEGRRTMARQTIEVTEPEVTISAPDEIRAGDTIRVEWAGTVHPRDYITIVPAGSDGDSGDYFRVGDKSQSDISAPETTGLYELRYILNEGKRVMASTSIEVLAEDAALEKGASIDAPETGAPGATIEVTWNVDSESADQRVTLARGNQAIFTWIEAVKTGDGPPVRITLPETAGVYELRFLDVANQAVLARKVIKVE
ncbi:hypothetical protein M8756_17540, partial [Lutimaribacter sp. EGI FJ00015]|nr:hypothetical protein [Lutimaribacter sp. EGI FJ00013]MCO0615115.1 hypothetical protein [Lutimaribacter sp. EGI FJ00015]MCO0637751.1 hypothetical protein [Lutimaribacter sp. EGI FJ00014]